MTAAVLGSAQETAAQIAAYVYLCYTTLTALSQVLLRPQNRSATIVALLWKLAEWWILAALGLVAAVG